MSAVAPRPRRPTQAERRARTHNALLEAAARGLSRHGYSNLILERVASDAGYSRGALYHLFTNKEELALAVIAWVEENWWAEMGPVIEESADPADALIGIARSHAIFCRRDIARVRMVLSVEFSGSDHPVGRAVRQAVERVLAEGTRLIELGRESGHIPAGSPPRVLALALLGAIEGLVINIAGHAPFDEELAERAVRGILGLSTEESRAESGVMVEKEER